MPSYFVSGANQGIGHSVVEQLAEGPNSLVFLGSRNLDAGRVAASKITPHETSRVVAVQLDITDDNSIKAAKETVESELKGKGLDALVNNAAISLDLKGAALTTRQKFQQGYGVNVFGTAVVIEVFQPLLKKAETSGVRPRIINITSSLGSLSRHVSGHITGALTRAYPQYNTSKSALNAVTVYWAAMEPSFKVVAVCPGYTATALNDFQGTATTEEAAKTITKAAIEETGDTAVYFNKDGPIPW